MDSTTPVGLLVRERKKAQINEALSPFNRWVAGINLGHEPNVRECVWWYMEHGGAINYAEQHPKLEDVD